MKRVCAALIFCTLGCKTVPIYMHEIDNPPPFVPEPGHALVVFVRQSGAAPGIAPEIMDGTGKFLGSAVAGGHFAVRRAPGKQKFVVWTEGTDVLLADLAADRIYFVEVNPSMGVLRANFHFKASHRGTDIFPFKEEYLEGSTRYFVDPAQAEQETKDEAFDRNEHLAQVAAAEQDMNPAERAEHTLVVEDGHRALGVVDPGPAPTAQPVVATAPAPPPPPPPPPVTPSTGGAPPAPATAVAPNGPRGFAKGTTLRVKLKNGTIAFGEVVIETSQGLLLFTGAQTQVIPYEQIVSADVLTAK